MTIAKNTQRTIKMIQRTLKDFSVISLSNCERAYIKNTLRIL
jgi:hypothetical protein